MNIEEIVYQKLLEKNYKVATAESCTGGLLAGKIINVAGESSVIDMSFVTYSNEAKCELVSVNPKTIDKYGVVSEEVAKEMAIGAASKAKCKVGLSTTGLAGPKGEENGKVVGTVCFGIYVDGKVYTYMKVFPNISREYIRNESVNFILEKLIEVL